MTAEERKMLIVFNKPYGVLSQFTKETPGQRTLAEFRFPKRVYPIGRLDWDSEGMLLLSDEPGLNSRLLDPKRGHRRVYWAQVEGVIGGEALARLASGLVIRGSMTLPASTARLSPPPDLPVRQPPIRFRKAIPTSWIAIGLREGRNRQVRRMTAAAGNPTLRLIRVQIGSLSLPKDLPQGNWRELSSVERDRLFDPAGPF